MRELPDTLRALVSEASPADATQEVFRQGLFQDWRTRIEAQIGLPNAFKRAESERLSSAIRRLLTVLPDDLEPIPLNLSETKEKAPEYVSAQLARWREKGTDRVQPGAVALKDLAERTKTLAYFCDDVDLRSASEWIESNFGRLAERWRARDARRYVAVYLTRKLLNGRIQVQRLSFNGNAGGDALSRLDVVAEAECSPGSANPTSCPHYANVVKPFIERLDQLQRAPFKSRPPQPGDTEILAIGLALQSKEANTSPEMQPAK